jgi:hypothetical protein
MNPTKSCEILMCFLLKTNCIKHIKKTKESTTILKQMYEQIHSASEFIENEKRSNPNFYNLKLRKINNPDEIPRSTTLDTVFPGNVREHINQFSYYLMTYTFSLLERTIIIHFILEKNDVDKKLNFEPDIRKYNKYVDNMLVWLTIISKQASQKCSNNINVYVYMTSLKKAFPIHDHEVLDRMHVNTAFTYSCPKDVSEIVIFRKEEWFKVFLHETFHNFNLDFSDMDTTQCNETILELFHIKSKVNLYEAYAEFWAKVVNILLFSYRMMDEPGNIKQFIKYSEFLLNYERIHCFFQMVKVLKHNKMVYTDLYNDRIKASLYKEDTSVFSYYVITLILINNYHNFMGWCYHNNSNIALLQFTHTQENQNKFCEYIRSLYMSNQLLHDVRCSEKLLLKLNLEKNNLTKMKRLTLKQKNRKKELAYYLSNLRLSLCETE